ncbi:hypothetical protein BTN50_0735 [Candidatus Enterovibrio altilux]|uniref:Uncharacterized protein n=1 Tax=Candidatus Enterovibrio altilux TaxID=1927128 RepID=A0A291B8A6_9GAMM|nr:hypothetical protein BTN50_0735 [Candidatus Enterovibrio luxaltus]
MAVVLDTAIGSLSIEDAGGDVSLSVPNVLFLSVIRMSRVIHLA